MTERPILFSGPMVNAILEGRKTQTRRVAKFKPLEDGLNLSFSGLVAKHAHGTDKAWMLYNSGTWEPRTHPLKSPYGNECGKLWVRETWAQSDHDGRIFYRADADGDDSVPYLVDGAGGLGGGVGNFKTDRWHPSIFLPRKHSRINLSVVDVRIERLHAITLSDACAEGVDEGWQTCGTCRGTGTHPYGSECSCDGGQEWMYDELESYRRLWDHINGKTYPWESNPWVWVVAFRKDVPDR